jgi:hypothetical protein
MIDRSPDPSYENCDINVKIADLGDASWVVCINQELTFGSLKGGLKYFSKITRNLPK